MRSAIAECLKHASPVKPGEIAKAAENITKVDETVARAQSRLKELFGFEAGAKPAIEARIADLKRERERLLNLSKFGEYGCLSFEPLKWRDRAGNPRLVVLSLASPRFELSAAITQGWEYNHRSGNDVRRTRYTSGVRPKLPQVISQCYDDVLERLEARAREKKKSVFLSTECAGVIPEQTREKILSARAQFKEIFLIAEATRWTVTEKKPKTLPRPNPPDPIVAGFDGTNLWVIDSFDLTSIERLVKSEFTV